MASKRISPPLSTVIAGSVGHCNELIEAARTISLTAKILGDELDKLHHELIQVFSLAKGDGRE